MRVVLHVKGGLGNQLIQYAFVQRFLTRQNTELILDDSHFKYYGERKFFLADFPQKKLSRSARLCVLAGMYARIAYNRLHKRGMVPYWGKLMKNYFDDTVTKDQLMAANSGTVYVNGYFQNFEIFPLRKGNALDQYMDQLSETRKNDDIFRMIREADNPVMFHVRRGDYVTNEKVARSMGVCGLDYFKRGLRQVSLQNEYSPLFVFSDDPEYARELFSGFKSVHIVKGDTADPIHDFLLMRQFKYAVISNSTLSYMASMLSVYEDNVVAVPEPWFEDGQQFLLGTKKTWRNVSKA